MSDILKTMIRIWEMGNMDWLGFDNLERYSFHHLTKASDKGEKIIVSTETGKYESRA